MLTSRTVRIVTNPGSNLSAAAIARYEVELTPQTIMVDGVAHDTRETPSFAQIDAWVRGAKLHPYVVGTTAAEYVALFRRVARADPDILTVTSSRKIIGSYDAAVSASRTMYGRREHDRLEIAVADSGVTDAGAGFAVAVAGELARGGATLAEASRMLAAFPKAAVFRFVPDRLDYLVKGGRATLLKAWLADWMGVRPVIGFVDGEPSVVAKISASVDRTLGLVDTVTTACTAGERVCVAMMHGGGTSEREADHCERALRARLDVASWTVRPLSPSIYLHAGPGSLALAVLSLDKLGWRSDAPPLP
jgi:DegV family protein with EDD domain